MEVKSNDEILRLIVEVGHVRELVEARLRGGRSYSLATTVNQLRALELDLRSEYMKRVFADQPAV